MDDLTGIELSEFARKLKGLTDGDFCRLYPLACLVIDFTADMMNAKDYDTKSGRRNPPTLVGSPGDSPAPGTEQKFLQFLKKSDRNSFARKLTLGRSINNDLFIPHPSISKFHAFFVEGESPTPPLRDVGSTNGTFLEGRRLVGNRDYATASGNLIQFGSVAAYIYLPPDLFDYVDAYRRIQNLSPDSP